MTNEPAFPFIFQCSDGSQLVKPGMTMRQYYKAAAMLYIAAKANDWEDEPYIVAETCARYADAMLAEDEEHAKK